MKTFITLFVILYSVVGWGNEINNVYWVQFNTKINTPYSLSNPESFLSPRAIERRNRQGIAIDSTDLPVHPHFIDSINTLGFKVKHTSRWMNGAIAYLPSAIDIDSLLMPSFVSTYEVRKDQVLKSLSNKFSEVDSLSQGYYGNSFNQISMLNGHLLHEKSKGENIHVAVIDAGFRNADQISAFDSLRNRGGILGTFDFVSPGNDVYREHNHGTAVLSIMAGNMPGALIGAAPAALYWLLRSEDGATEFPVEEDYWIIAAEFADSVGCDVINTSLGYTTFDNSKYDHTYDIYNGNTLRISKAANLAVDKGMVVVCSAGNSGNDSWGHIVAPSEAKKVLSVAAVNSLLDIAGFSSRGFTGSGALPKPDIAAKGVDVTISVLQSSISTGNGTSFSSPLIAGMAACLVGIYPEKTAAEIIQLIKNLGDRFPAHNTSYGYGIPNFENLPTENNTEIKREDITNLAIYPNPFSTTLYVEYLAPFNQLKLYNFVGQMVFSSNLSENRTEISSPILSNLPKGVYFAVVKGDQQVETFKLIKY